MGRFFHDAHMTAICQRPACDAAHACAVLSFIIVCVAFLVSNVEVIGYCAAILTTVAFAPQVVRTWRVGGDQLSWLMLAMFGSGVGLWLIYGIVYRSLPMILANGLTALQVIVILAIKLRELGVRRTQRPSASSGEIRAARRAGM
jgi:MtN3 and saliva related transmembrane protein